MASIKGPGAPQQFDGSDLRIGIVHARWNEAIIKALVDGAKKTLLAAGVKEQNITVQSVPGSYELPFATQRLIQASHVQAASSRTTGATDLLSSATSSAVDLAGSSNNRALAPFDAVIAIGVLIKGATMHFEYIADAVSHGLMRVQLETGVPVIFGVLTLLNEEQGLERAGLGDSPNKHNHGEDWGHAAVELAVKRRGWSEGRIL
ncbi:hypothetical protein VTN49DRAFT_3754 [Thermomyces lanuginosus]|uniref:uncharacterized protein n=1 Tax=Thermomyces lanuginosus TaxID=5541 RepID=UPI0037438EB5